MNIALVPLIGYLLLTILLAVWAQRQSRKGGSGFIEEYFIGARTMGGFELAMPIIASYTSASSFVGGPGVAYKLGLGWVLLAMIQVPTTFLTLGVLGKRFAMVGRRIHAVTITDFLYARYRSDAVVILCSVAVLIFFAASMVAQFIGGARVFQAVTGYPYEAGLALFGITVVVYTTVGGFRAVAVTDALQGVVMLIASVVILFAVVRAGGGMEQCIQTLKGIDPGLISPSGAGNSIPAPMLFSFWILVGLGILGLPQTTQRCFGYKDSRSMHDAMIMGTLIIGFLLLFMHLAGVLGRAVMPGLTSGDLIIPSLILDLLPPFWAGVFVAGPLAAIMSTVDTMLLLVSASIIKDLYIRYRLKNDTSGISAGKLGRMSFCCTLAYIFRGSTPTVRRMRTAMLLPSRSSPISRCSVPIYPAPIRWDSPTASSMTLLARGVRPWLGASPALPWPTLRCRIPVIISSVRPYSDSTRWAMPSSSRSRPSSRCSQPT